MSEQQQGVSRSTQGAVGFSVWEQELPIDVRNRISQSLSFIPDEVPAPDGGASGTSMLNVM